MFLQSLYGLVDEAMESEIYDRISFINFLDYPESTPRFKNNLALQGEIVLNREGQDDLEGDMATFEEKGITVKSGTIQDATFIESDPGKHGKKKPPVPVDPEPPEMTEKNRGDSEEKTQGPAKKKRMTKVEKREARIKAAEKKRLRREERRSAKTRRSKDGTWTKKNNASHFGNKLHTVQGTDIPLIRDLSHYVKSHVA